MASGRKQQIAWFFIFLLAGNEVAQAARILDSSTESIALDEAARMYKARRSRATGFESKPKAAVPSDQKVEAAWQAENRKCRSSWGIWCKEGAAHPQNASVHRCAYQPLKGDVRKSYKCRVTDEWMLKGTLQKPASWWLAMQIKLLKAKTAKLVELCGTNSNQWKCKRRMQHVLRALRFISKASKDTFGNMTPEQVKESRDAANAARDQIGTIMLSPEKKGLFDRLAAALKKNKGLQQDPKETITRALNILNEDILDDDADSSIAEAKIEQMEAEGTPETVHETNAAVVAELEDDAKKSPSDLGQTFDNSIEDVETEVVGVEVGNTTKASLIQLRDGMSDHVAVRIVAFVALAALLVIAIEFFSFVIWGLIVFWILGSIFGCTVGSHWGENSQKKGWEKFKWWGGCVANWVTKPFVLMGKGIFKVGKWMFKGKKENSTDSLLQLDAPSGYAYNMSVVDHHFLPAAAASSDTMASPAALVAIAAE